MNETSPIIRSLEGRYYTDPASFATERNGLL